MTLEEAVARLEVESEIPGNNNVELSVRLSDDSFRELRDNDMNRQDRIIFGFLHAGLIRNVRFNNMCHSSTLANECCDYALQFLEDGGGGNGSNNKIESFHYGVFSWVDQPTPPGALERIERAIQSDACKGLKKFSVENFGIPIGRPEGEGPFDRLVSIVLSHGSIEEFDLSFPVGRLGDDFILVDDMYERPLVTDARLDRTDLATKSTLKSLKLTIVGECSQELVRDFCAIIENNTTLESFRITLTSLREMSKEDRRRILGSVEANATLSWFRIWDYADEHSDEEERDKEQFRINQSITQSIDRSIERSTQFNRKWKLYTENLRRRYDRLNNIDRGKQDGITAATEQPRSGGEITTVAAATTPLDALFPAIQSELREQKPALGRRYESTVIFLCLRTSDLSVLFPNRRR